MVQLRPFREADYPRMVEITNLIYPDDLRDVESVRHRDATWDGSRYEKLRLMAENVSGQVAGYGQINHDPYYFNPRKYRLKVEVDPAYQRRGIGGALYERLLDELRRRDAIAAQTSVRESLTASVDFVTRRGFVEAMCEWESVLDVRGFDFARFAGADERVARQGITLATLAEEQAR